ncbi:YsnF/AvaK domain-containing protein [Hymenobacter psychrophilus]|uniref:Conserved domain-containing protein n=1 Tax=Hymenobacter psychrophilus TaxID=651662 RepID=A0A1H3MXP9_9BACT|nr:YsnF/AvaK domain-containing protein [Hymenobacter psychrophilus]SDY81462.1 conserved domain-containing protein [Hymenobacter psychrophilus]
MKKQTVVGIFNTAAEAQKAVQQLQSAGFERDFVDMSQAIPGTGTKSGKDSQDSDGVSGFFNSLFGGDNDEARTYADVARSGHSVVTAHVDTAEQARKAADILDNAGALDVNSKAAEYGVSNNDTAGRDKHQKQDKGQGNGLTAKVIEEKLEVGKRTEQTGGVRLRSRIVEKPVEASVRLRQEHVTVQRTPVNRPATDADFKSFKEGEVAVTESAERAVVAKEAHVVEEVSLGKNVTEREETIRETVRNTEVDVEQIPGKMNRSAAGQSKNA